jgi:hypothetical protein
LVLATGRSRGPTTEEVKVNADDSHEGGRQGHDAHSTDEEVVDRALGVALDELIDAIQETKQAVWLTRDVEQHRALEALQSFLGEKAGEISVAEARIDGRSPFIVTPSGRRPRNLAARAGGDHSMMLELLLGDLEALAADVRQHAGGIAGREEAQLLTRLADGLDEHLATLRR